MEMKIVVLPCYYIKNDKYQQNKEQILQRMWEQSNSHWLQLGGFQTGLATVVIRVENPQKSETKSSK